jgi:6-phosphogluconate dehydrogenase
MKIAVTGLGRMGSQIARKLTENGHEVIAHNRSHGPIEEAAKYGSKAAYEKADVVHAFGNEQIVLWIMLPADVIDAELDKWLEILPENSIVIDGGNSDFRDAQSKAAKLKAKSISFLDIGTSGGVWGYEKGFSMMAGGDEAAFKTVEPALQTLAKPSGGYKYFGAHGSGQFVKMVHNAIEYGMMESLAEGYRVLKEGPYKGLNLVDAAEVWQQGSVVTSWLNELCRQALSEDPELSGVEGVVAESGETRWTLEVAKEKEIPLSAIQASFDVRIESQKGNVNFATKLLAAMRNKFGGHEINPQP